MGRFNSVKRDGCWHVIDTQTDEVQAGMDYGNPESAQEAAGCLNEAYEYPLTEAY